MKNDALKAIRFDTNGLVPVVAQQYNTREVLMLAWMNREAFKQTLMTGRVHYFSRSRGELWKKGETSGQEQHLVKLLLDCDGDAILALVDQVGVACHTGRRTCFFSSLSEAGVKGIRQQIKTQEQLYG
jgi:phosphoribosyl-AMP cyclohydrolase